MRAWGEVTIEQGGVGDAEAWLAFMSRNSEVPPAAVVGRLFDRVGEGEAAIALAHHRSRIVGAAYLDECGPETVLPGLWITSLVVRRMFRGLGLGGRLVRSLVEFANGRRLDRVYAAVHRDNLASQATFDRAGFGTDLDSRVARELGRVLPGRLVRVKMLSR